MSDDKEPIRMCSNCAYAIGELTRAGRCAKTGEYLTLQRMYPTNRCDENFSGWVQEPPLIVAPKWWVRIFSKSK